MRKLRAEAYNSTQWRKERELFVHEHPLCEDCLKKGVVNPATSVHHLKSPFKDGVINWELMYDWKNLVSLCHECHAMRHAEENGFKKPEIILQELETLLSNIPD